MTILDKIIKILEKISSYSTIIMIVCTLICTVMCIIIGFVLIVQTRNENLHIPQRKAEEENQNTMDITGTPTSEEEKINCEDIPV